MKLILNRLFSVAARVGIAVLPIVSMVAKQDRPNVLLIQVDDFGYDDLAMHGNEIIDTPNLDALGAESTRFDQFYVSSVCAPTRAALLTGRNFLRTGVSGVHGGRDYLRLDETVMAEPLQVAGYRTGMWGKWHSGKTEGYFPWDRGFDEAFYACLYNYFDNTGLLNGEEISTEGYATDAHTDFVIDFLARQRESEQPFFAYVPYLAPHNPWPAPEETIEKYRVKGLSHAFASLCAMIDNLDQNIGRLLAALDENGFRDETIVIFLSDNGPWVKSYRFGLNESEWEQRNPTGMRGRKGDNWENGIRSPLFFRIPGVEGGRVVEDPVSVEDLFPTILEYCGVKVPGSLELDGRSLVPAIQGKRLEPRPIIIASGASIVEGVPSSHDVGIAFLEKLLPEVEFERQRLGIRYGDYKLVRNEDEPYDIELFNLALDPLETKNLIRSHPSEAEKLTQLLGVWYRELLESGQTYRMPTFQIGYEGRFCSQIYAVAPVDASDGLVLKDHQIADWDRVGESAVYDINVQEAGIYEVALMTEIENHAAYSFRVRVGNSSVVAALGEKLFRRPIGTLIRNESAYWENFDLKETFREGIRNQVLGTIELEEGRERLHLELAGLSRPANEGGKANVIAIQLRKVK